MIDSFTGFSSTPLPQPRELSRGDALGPREITHDFTPRKSPALSFRHLRNSSCRGMVPPNPTGIPAKRRLEEDRPPQSATWNAHPCNNLVETEPTFELIVGRCGTDSIGRHT